MNANVILNDHSHNFYRILNECQALRIHHTTFGGISSLFMHKPQAPVIASAEASSILQ